MSTLALAFAVALAPGADGETGDSIRTGPAPPARVSVEWVATDFGGRLAADAPLGVRERDGDEFRRWLYDAVGALENRRLRAEFYARYPTPASFDRAAFKEFLMLDPMSTVAAIDVIPEPAPNTLEGLLRAGAVAAKEDGRYRGRHFRGGDGSPIVDERGDTVPVDPAVLNIGARSGAGSDAYAWAALVPDRPTTDDAALGRAPWNVVSPVATGDTVLAMGPAYAQIYADLAMLALLSGGERDGLAYLFGGASLAHLTGAALPFSTLQFGPAAIHPVPRPGIIGRIRQWLRIGRPRIDLDREALQRAVRLRVLGNQIPDRMGWVAPPTGRPDELEVEAGLADPWAEALSLAVARQARESGPDAFVAADLLISDAGREAPLELISRADAAQFARFIDTRTPEGERALERLRRLHQQHLLRVGSVGAAWTRRWEATERLRDDEEAATRMRQRILTRFVSRQLEYLSEAELRRTRFMVERGAPR